MKIIKLPNGVVLEEDLIGNKYWSLNGVFHRENAPAVEYISGNKYYYLNGSYHREDGPAIEHIDGYKAWYLNGKHISCATQKEFEQLMKLKAFW